MARAKLSIFNSRSRARQPRLCDDRILERSIELYLPPIQHDRKCRQEDAHGSGGDHFVAPIPVLAQPTMMFHPSSTCDDDEDLKDSSNQGLCVTEVLGSFRDSSQPSMEAGSVARAALLRSATGLLTSSLCPSS